jgi:fucose permease
VKKRILLIVSFLSFIALGLPDGMLGVAWPSISGAFGVPIGNLGVLMFGFTLGYVTTTALVGTIIVRFGYARVMIGAAISMTVGAVGMFLSPLWVLVIISMTAIGIGSGLLDAGLNAYGAAFFRPRDLNWLHAFYGVGATIGPAIMTPMIISDVGWPGGYGVLAVVATLITAAFVVTRASWNERPVHDEGTIDERPSSTHPLGRWRVRVIAAGSVALFFLYTGLEVVAGQWAFSLFTIERGISAATAGTWVGLYWASMTIGRIVFGWVSERLPVATILRGVLVTAAGGIALLFVQTPRWIAPVGLSILGLSLAPMFPLLIGETPKRVGKRLADHIIGFQIAAANVGAVALVGAVGFGVERSSFELIPVALSIAFVAFAALHEALFFLAPDRG